MDDTAERICLPRLPAFKENTFCVDQADTDTAEYVRADLHQQALDRIEELESGYDAIRSGLVLEIKALEAESRRLREVLAQSLGSLKFAQAHIPAADAKIFQRRIDLVRDVLIRASTQEGE